MTRVSVSPAPGRWWGWRLCSVFTWSDSRLRHSRPRPVDCVAWSISSVYEVSSSIGSARIYRSGRSFQVVYGSSTSSVVIICSVHQGSVLGSRLFFRYTLDLSDVVAAHDFNLHSYVDDSQLYLQCHRQDITKAVGRLEACIMDVSHWMVRTDSS